MTSTVPTPDRPSPAAAAAPTSPRVSAIAAHALLGFGEVQHRRLRPAAHRFRYPSYFLMLPLRSLARNAEAWGSVNHGRWGWISFFDADHGAGEADALQWVERVLSEQGITDADGEIWLHCYPRVLGFTFKPVSFWYCHRADGSLAAVVVEVNNTFGERHVYLLDDARTLAWGRTVRAEKVLHVSPFCRVAGHYEFRFLRTQDASDRTVVRIEHHDEHGPLVVTSVSGTLQTADAAARWKALVSMPLLTLGVVWRIHWQALQLWLKRVPFHRKPLPPSTFVSR